MIYLFKQNKTIASLYHHYSPPHIYELPTDYINLATNLHLEKRKLNGIRSVAKRTMRIMMLSAYEKMIHKRCDDYICT